MTGREVDDAQPPHAQRDTGIDEHPLVVGTAVADDVAHPLNQIARGVWIERCGDGRRLDESGYAAHGSRST